MKWPKFRKKEENKEQIISSEVKQKLKEKLETVDQGIRNVEAKSELQLMKSSDLAFSSIKNTYEINFYGHNKIVYTMPYTTFLKAPVERVVIAVTRALAIQYEDFEGRKY